MRKSRLALGVLCFVLALPLQWRDFATVGALAPLWKLVGLLLMAIGTFLFWREWRRMKRMAEPSNLPPQ